MTYDAGSFDIAVIGAGHAGIEAALAAARLGCSTIVFTINLDAVGNCPCNPSIGGTAKGHLVREIDALGGEMGRTADACTIQSRMLNLGKGPAVHSLRAQIDRNHYARLMKHKLETCPNLLLRQGEIVKLEQAGEEWLLTSRLEVPGGQGVCGGRVLRERSRRHVPGGVPAGFLKRAGHLPAAV